MVRFVSTRDKNGPSCSVSEALLKGLAPDGGLYVPSTMPQRPSDFTLKEGVSYAMYQAIKPFFEGDELEGDLLQKVAATAPPVSPLVATRIVFSSPLLSRSFSMEKARNLAPKSLKALVGP